MECPEHWDKFTDSSVFELLTRLCEKTVTAYEVTEDFGSFNKTLTKKLRSFAFSILLKKSSVVLPNEPCEPVMDMISDYFVKNCSKKHLGDYDNLVSVKSQIDWLVERDKTKDTPYFHEILACIVSLRNSVPVDHGKYMFENPFSFGKIDEILPTPETSDGDPKPYQYFPSHIFQLPFSINESDHLKIVSSSVYSLPMESFSSKPGTNLALFGKLSMSNVHSVSSRSSRGNHWSASSASSQSAEGFLFCPRLTGPRDIIIPKCDLEEKTDKLRTKCRSSLFSIGQISESPSIESTLTIESGRPSITSIWDLARDETEVSLELWQEASKMPAAQKRGLISSSQMQMSHWRLTHLHQLKKLNIISEVEFILHIKYLTMGIESSSFSYNRAVERFQMKPRLCLEGLLQSSLETYVSELLSIGTCYWKLNHLVTPASSREDVTKEGFVYKSMCDSIRRYLVWFRLEVDKIFGEGLTIELRADKPLPTLMEILYQLRPLGWQIQTMAKIYRIYDNDYDDCLRGAGLMAYLYNEISLISQAQVSALLYATLKATCCVYFRFIQRFIFEGELEDQFNEFFIRKDVLNVDSYNKRYWDKGFVIRNNEMVPEFLRGVAKYILLCGKSLRLLKLCNPDDPLCVLLSTEYPPIKCCLTFSEIEDQRKLYDQYRMQCLYVCGEPVTFHSLLVRKEAEKKAFREMVTLKQAETMEKLIEERKRLSRILSDNKRRQFSALRSAAEDAATRRELAKKKSLQQDLLIIEHQKASNRLHDLRIEEEKQKMNAYYTEIGKEVERRQMRSKWKIQRLKLDERRVQLLTSEKMSLSREKLELEHKAAEESIMACPADSPESVATVNTSEALTNIEEVNSEKEYDEKADSKEIEYNISDKSLYLDICESIDVPHSKPVNVENEVKTILEIKSPDEYDTFLSCNDNDSVNNNSKILVTEADNKLQYSNKNTEDNSVSDFMNRNSLSNLKVHKSLDFDLSPSDIINSNVVIKNVSFSDQNIYNTYQQQKKEVTRNKDKVLAHEFAVSDYERTPRCAIPEDNRNSQLAANTHDNRQEAHQNKVRILGSVTFDKGNDVVVDSNRNEMPQFDTEASREALRNKKRVLGDEFGIPLDNDSKGNRVKQKGSLTLDLKGCSKNYSRDWSSSKMREEGARMLTDSTPENLSVTPGEFQGRLDIETPSTFDVGVIGVSSATTLSPISSHMESIVHNSVSFTDSGFRFPNIIEQQSDEEETVPDYSSIKDQFPQTPESYKSFDDYGAKSSVWNFSNDDLVFDNFKPFGIERTADLKIISMDLFEKPLGMDNPKSPYSNVCDILGKVQKKPMMDTFKMFHLLEESENIVPNMESADSSMMAACLQRSVVIPLSYQMEMVNNATLKYFLVNCDLYEHLKSLCDYFFLMDGEFAKTICSKLFEKLNTTESPRELLNFATLHSILDKSFGSSIGGSNKYAENLSFIVSDMPLTFHHNSPDVLESLTLSYTVAWPINIILSQEALDRYAKVFQFLVKIRRISWVLEQDLEVLKMSLKEEFMVSRELLRSPQYHAVQIYRYTMSSLIRALHGYVSTTCLQSSWTEFEKDLVKVCTLDDLYAVHVAYVKKVLFRCLLNKRSTPIMKLLNDMFTVVLRFHHTLNARCWHIAEDEIHYTHPFFPSLREQFLLFDKMAKHLHKTASRLSDCGYQPHLVELVTMINMNGYYSGEN